MQSTVRRWWWSPRRSSDYETMNNSPAFPDASTLYDAVAVVDDLDDGRGHGLSWPSLGLGLVLAVVGITGLHWYFRRPGGITKAESDSFPLKSDSDATSLEGSYVVLGLPYFASIGILNDIAVVCLSNWSDE
jgi:hypothetical protein